MRRSDTSGRGHDVVLITGFEPWAEHEVNPAAEFLKYDAPFGDWQVVKQLLPVSDDCFGIFTAAIAACRPDVIVSLGLAACCQDIKVETQAKRTARFDEGPATLASSLAPESCVLSQDAGNFYCNDLFYLGLTACLGTGRRMAFIHLPKNADMNKVHDTVAAILAHSEAT